jgi:hypothetical protein
VRMRRSSAVIGAAVLLGCSGGGDGTPEEVALVDLVLDQDTYDGELVTTQGVVRTYDEPRHYWIDDGDQNRVELVPQDEVSSYLGDRIEVTGRFTFRDEEGRRIAVDDLEVVSEGDAEPA